MTFEKFVVSCTGWREKNTPRKRDGSKDRRKRDVPGGPKREQVRETHRGIEMVLRTAEKEMFLEEQRESR